VRADLPLEVRWRTFLARVFRKVMSAWERFYGEEEERKWGEVRC